MFISLRHFYLLFVLFFFSCSSADGLVKPSSLPSGSHSSSILILDDSDYDVRYYRHPSYLKGKGRFSFLAKDLLKGDFLEAKNHGYYYKVFYREGSNSLIHCVYEYRHHQLVSIIYYDYNEALELVESRHYLESGRLFIVGLYKSGKLYKRRQLKVSGRVRYVSVIKFVDKGMTEFWYTLPGQLSYVIHYDNRKRVVRYVYYKGGIVDVFIDYGYDKDGVLVRQDYYNKSSKLLKFVKYFYDSNGYLNQSKTYKSSKLISVTSFDPKSRETRVENYNKEGGLISYANISYSGGKKEVKWFDKSSFMTKIAMYNRHNDLISSIKYSRLGREINLVRNYFEGAINLKSEVYSYGVIRNRKSFNSAGNLLKEELFSGGNLSSYFKFEYNDKGQLVRKGEYSSQGYFLRSFNYSYNKSGLMVMEKVRDDKAVIGVRVFEYNKRMSLSSIKLFDTKDRLIRRDFIDSRSRLYKVENGLGGLLDNVVKYRFMRGSDLVSQEEHYDSYGNLIRVLTFVYDSSSSGRISREDGFDGKKQYLGSVLYEYNEDGILFRQVMLNHLKEPYEVVHFDLETGMVKGREKYKTGN